MQMQAVTFVSVFAFAIVLSLDADSAVLLMGTLAFDILQRLTGDWSVVNHDDLQSWAKSYAQPLIYDTPFVWFGFNLVRGIRKGAAVGW